MNSFWERIKDWWPARQRAIDIQILWPTCKEYATDITSAKAAFACHAYNDPAWLRLGREEIFRRIEELT